MTVRADAERPGRLFAALAFGPPPGAFEVVVADLSPSGAALAGLKPFAASFPWKYLRPGTDRLRDFVTGDVVVTLPGFAVPVGDAVGKLAAAVTDRFAYPGCRDAGVLVVEGLDAWGRNLTPAMVEDCPLLPHPHWARAAARPHWGKLVKNGGKPALPDAEFVLLTPAGADDADYDLGEDAGVRLAEKN